ncbi:MAG: YfhO family protein [Bacteroidales bacterium]|nr:YfhO family protein [Bacteroidales bacterium]
MKIDKIYIYYFFLFLTAFAALLPLILLWHPLKYDAIDQAYPWKYLIGECLQEGILPLWNPYQLLGSPMHADPQSSAWYPVTWFFGYFFGYDIRILSVDFFLHIFLAGMGMFYLAKQLDFRHESAFFMAVSYMLCGFFIGNAQHFMWVISGTWIPFIIGAFIALRKSPSLNAAITLGLAFFMIMTGGYPAFIFLLLYLLVAVFILFVVEFWRRHDSAVLYRYLKYLAAAMIFTILAGAVVIISVYFLQGEMTRSDGVTLRQALFGAFTTESLISLVLPFAVIRNMDYYGTDLSMSNGYFGLVTLVFFLAALMIRRTKLVNLFLLWGLFCLAAAVGSALPVREFLYHHIPLMNYFRFPALFRVFFIVSFIITAGFAFNEWINGNSKMTWRLRAALVIVMGITAGLVIYRLIAGTPGMKDFIRGELFIFSERSTIAQHMLFQGLIQLIILLILAWLIIAWKRLRHGMIFLLALVSFDLALAAGLNGPYTVWSHIFRSKEVHAHALTFPKGFTVPDDTPVIRNRDSGGLVFQTLWRNLNIFHKQVSLQGYNPLHLKGFEVMADDHPELFATILRNPLVYLAGTLSPLDSLGFHEETDDYDPSRIYLNMDDYVDFQGRQPGLHPGDTVYVTGFSPVKITARSVTAGDALINLLQNNYYGWKVLIDGQRTRVFTGNMSFISAFLPAGEHEVVFLYDPKGVKVGFWVSLVALTIGLMFLYAKGFIKTRP